MARPPNVPQGNRPFTRMSRNQVQQVLNQALALHQNGRLNEAATLYEQILQVDARNFDALHLLGIAAAQTKNYARAAELIGKAIKINPNVAIAHNNRGNALKDMRDFEAAVSSYNRAIALNSGYAEAYYNRGIAFEELRQLEKAVRSYDQAIALNPGLAAAYYNRGNALKDLGRLDAAIENYDRAIALKPDFADAYSNRGVALAEIKKLDQAVESCDHAIALNPHFFTAYYNRGNALKDLGRLDAAVESYDRAIALKPDYAEAYCNRGATLDELRQTSAALESFERAISLKPDLAEAYINRGNALRKNRQFIDSLKNYDQAIAIRPDFADAYYSRGNTLADLGQIENAVHSYDQAMTLNPDLEFLPGTLLYSRHQLCDWSKYHEDIERIEKGVLNGAKVTSPFVVMAISDSPALQRLAAEIWTKARYSLEKTPGSFAKKSKSEKIRIAYLSADFHESPIGYNLVGLFEAHDRQKFETYAISFGPDVQSPMRKRLTSAFDHFIDLRTKTDLEIVRSMHELQIDIAVDTMGPTENERSGIFALRCAPIQVNLFGWTSGADYMDYSIADAVVVPPGQEIHFTEKIVRIPCSYYATDDKRLISDAPPSRVESGLPATGFVFCAFNNSYKITPPVFDIWMRLLNKVQGSVLWLREKNSTAAKNLRMEAQKRGVDPDRILFAPTTPSMADHLARHRLADLFLDNFPYCAQTTASDALWAGLPLVTRKGKYLMSRIAASLLSAIKLPELITETPEEYEALALELATNPLKLGEIKRKLENNRLTTPLFNTSLYARNIEAAYDAMYSRYLADLPPDHIHIDNFD